MVLSLEIMSFFITWIYAPSCHFLLFIPEHFFSTPSSYVLSLQWIHLLVIYVQGNKTYCLIQQETLSGWSTKIVGLNYAWSMGICACSYVWDKRPRKI
jgi:hypothetical protein